MNKSLPKKRFPIGRVARLAFRALAFAMLLLLLVGWFASYRWRFVTTWATPDGRWVQLNSFRGSLQAFCVHLDGVSCSLAPVRHNPTDFHIYRAFAAAQAKEPQSELFFFRFRFEASDARRWVIAAPYWFLTTLAAMVAVLSFKRSWRFTTRELLLAASAIAALLAAAVWSMRG